MRRPDEPDPIELSEETSTAPEALNEAAREAADTPQERAEAGPDPEGEVLTRLQAEKEELMRALVRRQADFENYRKRIERQRGEEAQRALAGLIETLLPVLDAFERALAAHGDPAYEEYRKGFELIYKQLTDALARCGLERIEAAGKPFDPFYHHAVERVESTDHEDETVIAELQAGYRLRERIVRPAMVRVAVHPKEPVH